MPRSRVRCALLAAILGLGGFNGLGETTLAVEAKTATPAPASPDPAAKAVHFGRQIQPLLAKRCFACHGPDKAEGGLRLNRREAAFAELDSGAKAIVPGKVDASELLRRVRSTDDADRMPPTGPPLSPEQIALLQEWIATGAKWEEHWAFRAPEPRDPPQVANPSWVRNPIDAFILKRLEESGLKPAPAADRVTLLRRAIYDLTGLPPTPEEVAAFLADKSPDAYEKLLDRLMASPHYGEQWARYWLDLVRYADTNSFERDGKKPHSWRYRDYVIRSFNADKPYDAFVREQLAGDEFDELTDDSLIATGFYRLGLWDDEPADRLQFRYDVLDDIVATTGQVFLGLTVNCARCHDHKIDPILQKEYYTLLAFFHNIRPMTGNGPNIEGRLPGTPGQNELYERQRREINERRDALQVKITATEDAFRKLYEGLPGAVAEIDSPHDLDDLEYRFYRDHWEKLPDFDNIKPETVGKLNPPLFDISPATRPSGFGFVFLGVLKVPKEGEYTFSLDSDDGSRLLIDGQKVAENDGVHGTGNPQIGRVLLKAGRLPIRLEYFQGVYGQGLIVRWSGPGVPSRLLSVAGKKTLKVDNFDKAMKRYGAELLGKERFAEYGKDMAALDKLKDDKPAAEYALVVTENGNKAPDTFVLNRGNAHVPGEKVEPAFLSVLGGGQPTIAKPSAKALTSGRRSVLAAWIASPENRLTARVMANRIWQHHFGRGIVRSPNNFGELGDPPTHPELLDWLAIEFTRSGWRMKALHRLIMTSNTYRMSSQANPAGLARDPANQLFWRFDMRRLSAEEIRDSIHAVSGRLNPAMYGPGIFPEISREVLAGQSKPGDGWGKSTPEEQARRSIYIHVKRSLITPILADFDFADTDTSCAARFTTTQPTQALGMLNGAFIHRQAAEFASRLRREGRSDLNSQVQLALRLALSREPEAASVARGVQFMSDYRQHHGVDEAAALSAFCLLVFNLNEFVYLD